MRNLKKILAMVLALIMSLSLMSVASAAETTAADNSHYKTAQQVLEGLKVFKGDAESGAMRYDQSINRAETAALVYRIHTSDVEDAQAGIYTNHPFQDVAANHWGRNYIAYAYNAEIVKGTNAEQTQFDPDDDVTGYQVLAMVLRTLGYGRNHEFEGPGWEVQTAATAKQIGLLKGVTAADENRLGSPAQRGLVAQILFNSLLQKTVKFSALNPYNYEPTNGQTMGYQKFGLEEIEGVVTGNEFADLNSVQVLDAGMTQLKTDKEIRDLAISTRITDIGESRIAYITGTKVLAMDDTGKNKVTTTGEGVDISTTAKFNTVAGMPAASDIEYYLDFDRVGTYTCDQRLEFVVTFTYNAGATYKPGTNTLYTSLSEIIRDFETRYVGGVNLVGTAIDPGVGMTRVAGSETGTTVTYSKIIRAESDISELDLDVIRGIFVAADNNNNSTTRYEGVEGDVFVGTLSNAGTNNNTLINDARDLSNQISYKKFVEEYISSKRYDINWNTSSNGDWVKFVDNNGDGKAEYAFKTESWLDQAIETYTNRNNETVTQYYAFDDDTTNVVNGDYNVRYLDNDGNDTDTVPAVGDKVVCAFIDNQVLVEPALDETVTVSNYNWKEDTISTDKGEYGQSFIGNETKLQELLSAMSNKGEYKVYFDHFGYIRAYEMPGETTYALLTEIYARNNNNGNLVQNWPMTAELIIKDGDPTEYNLNGGGNNLFVTKNVPADRGPGAWAQIQNLAVAANYWNWLQPATAHMGVTTSGLTPDYGVASFSGTTAVWSRNRQLSRNIIDFTPNDTFNYGASGHSTAGTVSFTNVAIATVDGENVSLAGAAQVRRDKQGNVMYWDSTGDNIIGNGDKARYSIDYVQLTTAETVKGQTRYPISDDYTGWLGGTDAKGRAYVNATHDTEYYIVYNGGWLYFTDYVNMLPLTNGTGKNNIRAAYAIARDTSSDNAYEPYWVADVIVYEIQSYNDESTKTSTALVYYNPSRTTDQVQRLSAIDSVNSLVDIIPDPLSWLNEEYRSDTFGPDYAGYGFYQIWDGEKGETDLAAGDIILIDGEDHTNCNPNTCDNAGLDLRWNSNLIYAGIVTREVDVANRGTYIDIDTTGDGSTNVSLLIKDSASSNVYSITTDNSEQGITSNWSYNEANQLRYSSVRSSEIKVGDRLVWVATSSIDPRDVNNTQSASFVVDLGNDVTVAEDPEHANADLKAVTARFMLQQWIRDGRLIGNFINTSVMPVRPYNPTDLIEANANANDVERLWNERNGLWQNIMYQQRYPATVVAPVAVEPTVTVTSANNTSTSSFGDGKELHIAYKDWKAYKGQNVTITVTPNDDNLIVVNNKGDWKGEPVSYEYDDVKVEANAQAKVTIMVKAGDKGVPTIYTVTIIFDAGETSATLWDSNLEADYPNVGEDRRFVVDTLDYDVYSFTKNFKPLKEATAVWTFTPIMVGAQPFTATWNGKDYEFSGVTNGASVHLTDIAIIKAVVTSEDGDTVNTYMYVKAAGDFEAYVAESYGWMPTNPKKALSEIVAEQVNNIVETAKGEGEKVLADVATAVENAKGEVLAAAIEVLVANEDVANQEVCRAALGSAKTPAELETAWNTYKTPANP